MITKNISFHCGILDMIDYLVKSILSSLKLRWQMGFQHSLYQPFWSCWRGFLKGNSWGCPSSQAQPGEVFPWHPRGTWNWNEDVMFFTKGTNLCELSRPSTAPALPPVIGFSPNHQLHREKHFWNNSQKYSPKSSSTDWFRGHNSVIYQLMEPVVWSLVLLLKQTWNLSQ